MGRALDKLKEWNRRGLDFQQGVMKKAVESLTNIDEMPEGPQKDAAYAELDRFVDNPALFGFEEGTQYVREEGGQLIEAGVNATLDVVRGLGGAIVDGLDSAYDAARAKLSGREPDVIAGIVVVALTVLTVTYIYHSAKVAGDAF